MVWGEPGIETNLMPLWFAPWRSYRCRHRKCKSCRRRSTWGPNVGCPWTITGPWNQFFCVCACSIIQSFSHSLIGLSYVYIALLKNTCSYIHCVYIYMHIQSYTYMHTICLIDRFPILEGSSKWPVKGRSSICPCPTELWAPVVDRSSEFTNLIDHPSIVGIYGWLCCPTENRTVEPTRKGVWSPCSFETAII